LDVKFFALGLYLPIVGKFILTVDLNTELLNQQEKHDALTENHSPCLVPGSQLKCGSDLGPNTHTSTDNKTG
jgi:hypothetical protein